MIQNPWRTVDLSSGLVIHGTVSELILVTYSLRTALSEQLDRLGSLKSR
eukprot:COSAG02_NODE_19027_length_904_cov_1.245963_1_plen_48_part_01